MSKTYYSKERFIRIHKLTEREYQVLIVSKKIDIVDIRGIDMVYAEVDVNYKPEPKKKKK